MGSGILRRTLHRHAQGGQRILILPGARDPEQLPQQRGTRLSLEHFRRGRFELRVMSALQQRSQARELARLQAIS